MGPNPVFGVGAFRRRLGPEAVRAPSAAGRVEGTAVGSGREVSVGTVLRRFDPRSEAARCGGKVGAAQGACRSGGRGSVFGGCDRFRSATRGPGGHGITGAKRSFVACGRMGDESMNRQWCKDCI